MTTLTVDVVIPLYNNEKYAVQAIRSVLAQTMPVHGIVVVDDGSIDRSADIVEQAFANDPRISVFRVEHKGLSATRNRGIVKSDAEFIAFLDSDDLWRPDKLEKQFALFAAQPELGCVYSSYAIMDENGMVDPEAGITQPTLRGDVFTPLLSANLISGSASAIVIRRATLDRAGLFDETLGFAEDWDMWLRLAKIARFDFVDEKLTSIRRHSGQMQAKTTYDRRVHRFAHHLKIWSKWPEDIVHNPDVVRDIRVNLLRLYLLPSLSRKRRKAVARMVSRNLTPFIHPCIARAVCGGPLANGRVALWLWLQGAMIFIASPLPYLRYYLARYFPRLRGLKRRLIA